MCIYQIGELSTSKYIHKSKIVDTHVRKYKPTSNVGWVTKDNKTLIKILNSLSKPTRFSCSLLPVKRIYSKHNQDEQQMISMMTYTKLQTFSLWFIFFFKSKSNFAYQTELVDFGDFVPGSTGRPLNSSSSQ